MRYWILLVLAGLLEIGWAIGPAPLVRATQKAHQFVTFATASPFQEAIAKALRLPDAYFEGFEKMYRAKRDFLIEALKSSGFEPFSPQGTYFVIADAGRHAKADDFETCRWLTREVGVAAIPPSASRRSSSRTRRAAAAASWSISGIRRPSPTARCPRPIAAA